jgi:hypothetical protein
MASQAGGSVPQAAGGDGDASPPPAVQQSRGAAAQHGTPPPLRAGRGDQGRHEGRETSGADAPAGPSPEQEGVAGGAEAGADAAGAPAPALAPPEPASGRKRSRKPLRTASAAGGAELLEDGGAGPSRARGAAARTPAAKAPAAGTPALPGVPQRKRRKMVGSAVWAP